MNRWFIIAIYCWVGVAIPVDAADYLSDIKPVFKARCYACHGALKQKADLRLDTAAAIRKGAKTDVVVVPGKPAESELLARVLSHNPEERMPPEGSLLKPQEVEAIRQWIGAGAPAPEHEEAEADPRDHWAFQVPEKVSLGKGEGNPIDILLEKNRASRSLKTQPLAERSILIRRLYLDLIGLPPTRAQLNDQRPWNEIVDELLKNPQHGERWARHWMDIWRYTDWYGLGKQLRNSQKHIWHWRDWIVESLNQDKGYDRMIQEMIAADELAPEDPDALRATGFLARNYYLFNRTTWLDATIEHTGKALLGLTLNCAKCHDHKYDPISNVDYYRLRAIFEPHQVRLDPVPGVMDFEKDGLPRVFDDHPDIKTYLHQRGDPKNPDKDREITPAVPAILAHFAPAIKPVNLPLGAYAPGTRDYVQKDHLQATQTQVEVAGRELDAAKKRSANAPKEKPKPVTTKEPPFEVKDDFSKPNPKLWELIGKGWKFKDGALHQTTSTRDKEMVLLRKTPPRDFELICRYTHTGGDTYKSVTFRFDQTPDRKYANFVYTSAHAPGPKLHVAHTRNGQGSYPSAGHVGQPIKVGETYTLRFALRDRLINVWLNDKFLLAYTLPDRKPGGQLSLSGFDATVAFDDITIRSLPTNVKLAQSKNAAPKPKAKDSVETLAAKLVVAKAKAASLKAIFAADKLKYRQNADPDVVKTATLEAAKREAEATRAQAQYDLLASGSDEGKVKAAKGRIAAAEKKLAAITKGEGSYTSIRASKKALETPAHKEADYPVTYSEVSTGRRLALAKWIATRKNPLTARVAVNHVWLRHFGEPLVESVDDFGLRAKRPVQVQLLDYLAADFMESGWSFRYLHRLITTSRAYRLSSSTAKADPKTLAADSNNHYYWRMNTRRMEAQVVRDSLLQLAGVLDTKMGGPSVNPGDAVRRRSIYFKHSRDQQDKFLKMFNDADHLQCYRRTESIVPQQALALANGKLAIEMSGLIAKRMEEGEFVELTFGLLLGRKPDSTERQACMETLDKLEAIAKKAGKADPDQRARRGLVHALLNHNDFVSIR